jgi:hypothetical protein
MDEFHELTTRAQYTVGIHESDDVTEQAPIAKAARLAETDPARLQLAAHVLHAALNVLNAELSDGAVHFERPFAPPVVPGSDAVN